MLSNAGESCTEEEVFPVDVETERELIAREAVADDFAVARIADGVVAIVDTAVAVRVDKLHVAGVPSLVGRRAHDSVHIALSFSIALE